MMDFLCHKLSSEDVFVTHVLRDYVNDKNFY